MDLRHDPRVKPDLLSPPVGRDAPPEVLHEALHDAFSSLYAALDDALPGDAPAEAVETSEVSVPSPDGHLVPLRLYRPAGAASPTGSSPRTTRATTTPRTRWRGPTGRRPTTSPASRRT
jgi:hypothetical protein